MKRDTCSDCGSGRHKKNGHIHKMASRTIVSWIAVVILWRTTLSRLSRKRRSRHSSKKSCWSAMRCVEFAVFRCHGVVAGACSALYAVLPADLGINQQNVGARDTVSLYTLTVEAEEMWSSVAKKSNKQWLWIALDAKTRQVFAFPCRRP